MADAIISAVIGDLVSRVISRVIGNFSQRQSTDAKLQRIGHMLVRIHSVIEEAKRRHITNDGILQWLSKLIVGEYQGQYLLDMMLGCREHEVEDGDNDMVTAHQASSISLFNSAKRMRITAYEVKDKMLKRDPSVDEIDRVLESLQALCSNLKEFIMLLQSNQPICMPLTTSIFIESQMFGRYVEKERIINFLLHDGNPSRGQIGVLPIVGDVGVGKTTLVQHACDDPRVRNHFTMIMLCCTCTTPTNGKTAILQSEHVTGHTGINLNDLTQLQKGCFDNERLLLVFEDVDLSKRQMLDNILRNLRCSKAGSKVIISTNNWHVTTIGTVEPIILKALPCSEYWFFFKNHAFAGRDLEENRKLVTVGKAIARKLNGSFFGAKIVGGVLRERPDPRFWCKILRSNIGGLSLLGDGIGYVTDLAENMLPGNMTMFQVTISKDQLYSQTELGRLHYLHEPRSGDSNLEDDVKFSRVLLCKSVLPFHNRYYIASCTIGSVNSTGATRFATSADKKYKWPRVS